MKGPVQERNRRTKRVFDLIFAFVLIPVALPVSLVAAFFIWVTSGAPVFYVSTRYIGLNRPIHVVKFRTMVRDATSPKYRLHERFMRDGFLDIPISCEIYTPIGRILERFQIVELPQLLNVIVHGMSLVGNRPLPKENFETLSRLLQWETRFDSPAGITGISQVVGKFNLQPRERVGLESLYSKVYFEGNILKCDVLILWHTIAAVLLRNKGISVEQAESLLRDCIQPK